MAGDWPSRVAGFPPWLLGLTLQATVALMVAWAVDRGLARASAAVRHRVWGLALGVVVICPVLTLWPPGWQITIGPGKRLASHLPPPISTPSRRPPAEISTAPARLGPVPVSIAPAPVSKSPVPADPAATEPTIRASGRIGWSVAGWISAIWLAGLLAVIGPTLVGLVCCEHQRWRADRVVDPAWVRALAEARVRLGVRRRVLLLQTDCPAIPLTWGIVRPVILIPASGLGWGEATRRSVLGHELAHLARGDVAWQLLARLATAMVWFHPLVWWAARRLRHESEHAADDLVVRSGVGPTDYASDLLALVRSLRSPRFGAGLAMARTPLSLEQRMLALFDDRRNHAPIRPPAALAAALGAALALAALTGFRVGSAPAGVESASALAPPGPQAATPPVEPAQIAGTVVRGEAGTAAGGATVQLVGPPPPGRTIEPTALFPRTVTADPQGHFVFPNLQPGNYQVWATQDQATSRTRMIGDPVRVAAAEAGPPPLELRLRPGVALTVDVRAQATGRPIPGAVVRFRYGELGPEFRTDAAGRVVARPITPETWEVEVWAEGFARSTRQINLETGRDAAAEFRLEPGGVVGGTIRDAAGRPLGRIGIGIMAPSIPRQVAWTRTDADGHYRFPYLPFAGDLNLTINEPAYQPVERAIRPADPPLTLNLTLEPRPDGGAVAGVIRDRAGKPIADAAITNMGNSSNHVRSTRSGPDGRFRLANLFDNISFGKSILIQAPGHAPERVQVTTGPNDRPTEIAITLEPGHRIGGRVVDDSGEPIGGVDIDVSNAVYGMTSGPEAKTTADGRFAFDALPATSFFRFAKAGYSEVAERELPLDTPQTVDVAMLPVGVLTGQVLDAASGRPVPGFTVQVTFSPLRRNDEPSNGLLLSLSDPGQTFAAPDGRFRINPLVARMPLQVMVAAPGYERTVVERVEIAPARAGRSEVFRLVPIDPARLVTYAGRLLTEAGQPVAGAEVRLIGTTGRDASNPDGFPFNWSMIRNGQLAQDTQARRFLKGVTDGDGRFRFPDVPRDLQVELAWWGSGITAGRRRNFETLPAPERSAIAIKIPAAATLVVQIDRRKYPTAERLTVSWPGSNLDRVLRQISADSASVTLDSLDTGRCAVTLTTAFRPDPSRENGLIAGPDLATTEVVLEPGATAQVEFR